MKSSSSFRGRYELKADPKFRLTLPSGLRRPQFMITNSQFQGHRCLDVYTVEQWQKLEKNLASLPQLKTEVQSFQRFYLSGGHEVELDSQGRILIPPTLRTYAQLQSDIVVVGLLHKFEIWAAATWNVLFETLAGDFEKTIQAVSLLEGSKK